MARGRKNTHLNVFLNERLVGQLTRETTGAIRFKYADTWLDWPYAFPVSISLPLQEDQFVGSEVIAVFDNLLPDNKPIRNIIAERVGAQGTDAFSLLSVIGKDCVGALQFLPIDDTPQTSKELTGKELSNEDIEKLLSDLDITPLGIHSENDVRISVAGTQEKTALLFHEDRWIEPHGTTPTTHILKPQIGKLANGMDLSNSVENEFLCLNIMQGFGLKTAHTQVEQFGNQKALVVKRFDRKWTETGRLIRLPQEDCCQALSIPPTQKYQSEGGPGIEDIMEILRGSDNPVTDRIDFFKAQILFWLIGATDGHAKNFSLALTTQGRFTMAPLYDVITAQPSYDDKQLTRRQFKMAMRVGHSNHYNVETILGRHFVQTGLQCGLSPKIIENLFDEIQETAESTLQSTFDTLPTNFPEELADSIAQAVQRRLPRLVFSRGTSD